MRCLNICVSRITGDIKVWKPSPTFEEDEDEIGEDVPRSDFPSFEAFWNYATEIKALAGAVDAEAKVREVEGE